MKPIRPFREGFIESCMVYLAFAFIVAFIVFSITIAIQAAR